jgi:histidinol-phosphate aminotransferase
LLLRRYPDPLHLDLKEEIAKLRNVKKEQIFLGVGSDEAIDILFRIFCNPREDNALIAPPTYGMYKVCAKINDVGIKSAPLTPSFDVDLPALLAGIDEHTKLVFLCSPGNPTCKVIPNSVVEEVLAVYHTGILVVDEAYIDFSGTDSACSLIEKYPNVVVLQTMSKAFGLAGIRLGMCFGSENVVQLMNNIKAPYNINKLTAEVAVAAFKNLDLYRSNVAALLLERNFLLDGLKAMMPRIKKIHHSDANFILFVIPKAETIYKIMADRGVVCRFR